MLPFGTTRTVIHPNHAFIAPDGHVSAALPGWSLTDGIILISPHMRNMPKFSQYLATMQAGGKAGQPLTGVQRFIYVMEGVVEADIEGQAHVLEAGKFAYIPANVAHSITAPASATLMIFEKRYIHSPLTTQAPAPHVGDAWAGEGTPFMGDDAARLRVLLPTDLPYDMAVNLFTFQPGAALPFVETHIMEHGMTFVEGQGIYRLDDQWYPVQKGDTLWMGGYCPQWFCAIGKTQSTYLYYKDMNRDALT
jgi:(S)-ureidoglycine aminohydrolase